MGNGTWRLIGGSRLVAGDGANAAAFPAVQLSAPGPNPALTPAPNPQPLTLTATSRGHRRWD
jgi:hypothetical protein